MHILELKNVKCYLVEVAEGYAAFDVGWPDSYREYKAGLKRLGLGIGDLSCAFVSHFHIDHAGLLGLFQDKGIQAVAFDNQVDSIGDMEDLIARKGYEYSRIDRSSLRVVRLDDSGEFLRGLGVAGRIVRSPGHGEQSLSLVLDSGEALIGDLPPEDMYGDFDPAVTESWAELRKAGARRFFPAHAESFGEEG